VRPRAPTRHLLVSLENRVDTPHGLDINAADDTDENPSPPTRNNFSRRYSKHAEHDEETGLSATAVWEERRPKIEVSIAKIPRPKLQYAKADHEDAHMNAGRMLVSRDGILKPPRPPDRVHSNSQ